MTLDVPHELPRTMKLLSLTCQHCSAPLEVPAKITQLTCQFCGTRLQVQRTGSAAYTEALDEVSQQVQRVADSTEQIRIEQELARLDRDWQLGRERFMVRGKDGELNVPVKAGVLTGGVIVIVFGIFWTVMASGIAAAAGFGIGAAGGGPLRLLPGFFPCFGVLFVIFGIVNVVTGYRKAVEFEQSQQQYHKERCRLLAELNSSVGTAGSEDAPLPRS